MGLTRKLLGEFQPDISVLLTPTDGGRFEVLLNDTLIFSKYQTDRFPQPQEIIKSIKAPT